MSDSFEENQAENTSPAAAAGKELVKDTSNFVTIPLKKKHLLPALLVFLFMLITIIVCVYVFASKKNKASGFMPGMGGANRQQNVVSVRTTIAKKDVLHDYVNTNGEISPQSSIDVFPDIGGKITRVNVSLGSYVQRGDVIAEVDPSAPGMQYRHSMVTAPISGTITRSPLKTGTTVSQNTTITVIGDVENLQILANVPERYVSALRIGLKADIVLEAYPDKVFSATVTRVSPLVDTTSRTKEVLLNFDKQDNTINAGMFAKVHLWTLDYEDEIVIPSNAIIEKNDKQYVYVIQGGSTAEEREITTGHTVDDHIQITSGVREGETVVIEGMRVLSNGAQVKDITHGTSGGRQ